MKALKLINLFCIALVLGFTSCGEPVEPEFPSVENEGTETSPYTVVEAIGKQGSKDNTDYKWVKGYIVGIWEGYDANGTELFPNNFAKFKAPFYTSANILIAASPDETNVSNMICVQLSSSIRPALNLVDNVDVLKKEVLLCGTLDKYNSMPGMKLTTYYAITGGASGGSKPVGGGSGTGMGTEDSPYDVAASIKNQGERDNANYRWVKGYIVGIWEGKDENGNDLFPNNFAKFEAPFYTNANLLLAASPDETNTSNMICVQLPGGAVRDGLNLVDNADVLKKEVLLCGALDRYNNLSGMKLTTYYAITGGASGGSKPTILEGILAESLLTQASYDKFTAVSVTGDQAWGFDAKYGAVVSGYQNNTSYANEDWFISPAMDLSGKTGVKLAFEHARGPAGSITIGVNEGYYTVWVSNNYSSGAPSAASWTEITGVTHGTEGWGFVSSGQLAIPTANLAANCRIAFKYLSIDGASATWEVKNVVVR